MAGKEALGQKFDFLQEDEEKFSGTDPSSSSGLTDSRNASSASAAPQGPTVNIEDLSPIERRDILLREQYHRYQKGKKQNARIPPPIGPNKNALFSSLSMEAARNTGIQNHPRAPQPIQGEASLPEDNLPGEVPTVQPSLPSPEALDATREDGGRWYEGVDVELDFDQLLEQRRAQRGQDSDQTVKK